MTGGNLSPQLSGGFEKKRPQAFRSSQSEKYSLRPVREIAGMRNALLGEGNKRE
jgi:hypothetical protein